MNNEPEVTLIANGRSHILAGVPLIRDYWILLESLGQMPEEIEVVFNDATLPDESTAPFEGAHEFHEAFGLNPLGWTLYGDPAASIIRLVIKPTSQEQKLPVILVIQALEFRVNEARALTATIARTQGEGFERCARYYELRQQICSISTET
jgi:hypothetical protein